MTVEKNLIELGRVDGKDLIFERHGDKCWINLTRIAQQFGKKPDDWLKTKSAQEYLEVARKRMKCGEDIRNTQESESKIFETQIEPIIIRKGNTSEYEQGTWATDTRVARRFFQWLSPEYAWEVDDFLDRIARGELIVNDSSLFRLGGEQWVSCTEYCKAFGKSMHSFYGLKGNYPQSFCNWKGQWYMNHRLFVMKEIQARFEDRRTELRGQGDKRQLSIHFPDEACMTELFSKEQK